MRVPVMQMRQPSSQSELERQVLQQLKWLSFGAFERAVQVLLRSEGYREVVIVGNMNWRGRSRFGGTDLRAWFPTSRGRALTLIQVKQPDRDQATQRRFVDELRGTMLRFGATRGFIITTATFSKPAVDVAAAYPRLPVKLMNGQTLAKLMVKHAIGLRLKPLTSFGLPELMLDGDYFERLEELGQK